MQTKRQPAHETMNVQHSAWGQSLQDDTWDSLIPVIPVLRWQLNSLCREGSYKDFVLGQLDLQTKYFPGKQISQMSFQSELGSSKAIS